MGRPLQPLAERFWRYVERRGAEDCWPWIGGAHTDFGYGLFTYREDNRSRCTTSHKMAVRLSRGEVPGGLVVRHSCDNPVCCNPGHLLVGTHQDNHQDMVDRGRSADQRGVKRAFAPRMRKLTDADVVTIRTLWETMRAEGLRCIPARIGARFDVSEATVRSIAQGKRKAHVLNA